MKKYVMKVVAVAGTVLGGGGDPTGLYLKSYDPDAMDGRGAADFVSDRATAMQFETQLQAMALWRKQSSVRPLRPDGKPNRPLTAYTVTFEEVGGERTSFLQD